MLIQLGDQRFNLIEKAVAIAEIKNLENVKIFILSLFRFEAVGIVDGTYATGIGQ